MNNAKKIRGLEKDLESIMQELEDVLIFEIERMHNLGIEMKMPDFPYAKIGVLELERDLDGEMEDTLCMLWDDEFCALENAALSDLQLLYHLGKMQEDDGKGKK